VVGWGVEGEGSVGGFWGGDGGVRVFAGIWDLGEVGLRARLIDCLILILRARGL